MQCQLSRIRLTAAETLAVAVMEYLPEAYRLSGGILSWGFYYDFVLSAHFPEEMLPLIEERMRHLAAMNFEIKIHEMLPETAIDYLRHHSHHYAAHFVSASTAPLVQILQMGEFVDRIVGECLPNSGELKIFKLLGISHRPGLVFRGDRKRVVRIYGTAFHEKQGLKDFLSKKGGMGYPDRDHLALGERMGLFTTHIFRSLDLFERIWVVWRGEGERLLHHFKVMWRVLHMKQGFELIQTTGARMAHSHRKFYRHIRPTKLPFRIAEIRAPSSTDAEGVFPSEGLFSAQNVHEDCAHIFCLRQQLEECVNNALEFLGKVPKILLLDGDNVSLSPNQVEKRLQEVGTVQICWMLRDGYGRTWQGPSLTLREWDGLYLIQWSAYFSVERMIALILEDGKKDLSQKKEVLSRIVNFDG